MKTLELQSVCVCVKPPRKGGYSRSDYVNDLWQDTQARASHYTPSTEPTTSQKKPTKAFSALLHLHQLMLKAPRRAVLSMLIHTGGLS